MGLTVGGSIGLERDDAMQLEPAPGGSPGDRRGGLAGQAGRPSCSATAARSPTPEDAAYVLARCDAVGFVGASSMERLPVETAITETMRGFKSRPARRPAN